MQTPEKQAQVHSSSVQRGASLTTWKGEPITLQPQSNVNMPQTANGVMVLAYQNTSPQNSEGTLQYTSGGARPVVLVAPPLTNQPKILINNWRGNNLSITNTSLASSGISIWVEALGPGLPGLVPSPLSSTGAPVSLSTGRAAQGMALPQYMSLVLSNNSPQLTIFTIIGGPVNASGSNAYVIALNSDRDSGPGLATPATDGYYATTTSNQYTFQFNWGSSTIFVANMSPAGSVEASVSLTPA